MSSIKRLFFGLSVESPWPKKLPAGRILAESDRHITLAFLGNVDYTRLLRVMENFPAPPFRIGLTGHFGSVLFLPSSRPRVAAWNVNWGIEGEPIERYQQQLVKWLVGNGFPINTGHKFLAHATLCRSPQEKELWMSSFTYLPLYTSALHLYESLGNCRYRPIWTITFIPPFIKSKERSQITIIGNTMAALHQNARAALCFENPSLTPHLISKPLKENMNEILEDLNTVRESAGIAQISADDIVPNERGYLECKLKLINVWKTPS